MIEERFVDFSKPLKVLIVEDNKIDRRIIESMLQERNEYASFLKAADTLEQAVSLMKEFSFDVIILDLNLPDSQGEATLIKITENEPALAIVVNTGAYEDRLGLKTLSLGAQDFLVKGKYTAYLLNKALHYAVERKRFELELKETYDRLKEVQAQLIQAEKMKIIGALASGVAHEVKNPLATILYGVTYLQEALDISDTKIKNVLVNIKDASLRADRIITDLLDFARLQQLDKSRQNINDIIEKALLLTKHELNRKNIYLTKRFDSNTPLIEIDANKIEQVFVNLILNAIHAMDRGGQLAVSSSLLELSGEQLEIPLVHRAHFKPKEKIICAIIEDNGCGISSQDLEKVFDPFYTTRREDGGVGLGLSVSRNIMEIHLGSISLESKKGRGVCAKLFFKLV